MPSVNDAVRELYSGRQLNTFEKSDGDVIVEVRPPHPLLPRLFSHHGGCTLTQLRAWGVIGRVQGLPTHRVTSLEAFWRLLTLCLQNSSAKLSSLPFFVLFRSSFFFAFLFVFTKGSP
jgi:hypothetical protein